ncbi:MAG: hypothetical protein HY079_05765 [Elusimicrobia bacterium]|nr:hypothetical protein [Elusimicrobiota bacterium]
MTIERLLAVLLLLAAPARAARRPVPPAEALLRAAVSAPSAARSTRVRVQAFDASGRAKAQYRVETVRPDGSRRVEGGSKKGGAAALSIVSDGKARLTAWPKAGRAWSGPAPAPDADGERTRLSSLYDLSVSTGGRVAGKAVWRLDMRSKADGRVRRSLWLAKTGGALLRREDYRPDGSLLRRERVTRLLPPADADFSPVPPAGAKAAVLPAWVPDGFALESRDARGAVLTDGLRTVAFVRGAAAPSGRPYAEVRLRSGLGRLYAGADGVRLVWSGGSLAGDVPEADLARMADALEAAR